jgi:hypothetical protein
MSQVRIAGITNIVETQKAGEVEIECRVLLENLETVVLFRNSPLRAKSLRLVVKQSERELDQANQE